MAMKQISTAGTENHASPSGETRNPRREQIPLRDLSECLLAAYEGVMQRAYRLQKVRGSGATRRIEELERGRARFIRCDARGFG